MRFCAKNITCSAGGCASQKMSEDNAKYGMAYTFFKNLDKNLTHAKLSILFLTWHFFKRLCHLVIQK